MNNELSALASALGAEIVRSERAYRECRDGITKMMLAAEFGALTKVLSCVNDASESAVPKAGAQ
jgi:hypothetical protein